MELINESVNEIGSTIGEIGIGSGSENFDSAARLSDRIKTWGWTSWVFFEWARWQAAQRQQSKQAGQTQSFDSLGLHQVKFSSNLWDSGAGCRLIFKQSWQYFFLQSFLRDSWDFEVQNNNNSRDFRLLQTWQENRSEEFETEEGEIKGWEGGGEDNESEESGNFSFPWIESDCSVGIDDFVASKNRWISLASEVREAETWEISESADHSKVEPGNNEGVDGEAESDNFNEIWREFNSRNNSIFTRGEKFSFEGGEENFDGTEEIEWEEDIFRKINFIIIHWMKKNGEKYKKMKIQKRLREIFFVSIHWKKWMKNERNKLNLLMKKRK